MTDEEFVFKQTERERKRNGIGTFKKVRQGGKNIRFPSDNMSKKELKKMNGEVKTYSFNEPMGWKSFIKMPLDLQQEYLDMLTEKYHGISNQLICDSLGVNYSTFCPHLSRKGLKLHRDASMPVKSFLLTDDGKKWLQWNSKEEVVKEEPVEEVKTKPVIVEPSDIKYESKVDVQNIATLLQMLSGSGAKLTIEITL